MAKIKAIDATEILNAKGLPAVEATVTLDNGKIGIASCPSSAKKSTYEAAELRDNDENRFEGQGVSAAIGNIKNIIAPQLIGKEVENQSEVDKTMITLDGTQNKSRLGANAMLAVSMAVAKAAAQSSALPLFLYLKQFVKNDHEAPRIPVPIFNLINGGGDGKNSADFHEFLVVPASSKPYIESIQIGETIRKALKQIVETRYARSIDDYEESIVFELTTNKEAFSLIQQAIASTPIKLGFDVFLGLNSKASAIFKDKKYQIKDSPTPLSSGDLVNFYEELNKNVHLLYLEDPLDQDDWDGWVTLYAKMATTSIIAGGDLVSTNLLRLQMAVGKKTINAVVIKPNQVGTVMEALAIAEVAKEIGLKIIVSHRSNETNDDFISDFSVAISADYIKIGSLARGENIAKYNRLLQIEAQLKIL